MNALETDPRLHRHARRVARKLGVKFAAVKLSRALHLPYWQIAELLEEVK